MTFVRPEQSRSPSLRDAPDSATRNNKRVADNPAVLAALLGLWGTRGSSQGSLESTAHVLPGAFVNGKAAAVGLSRQSIAESNLPRDDRGALSRAAGGYVPPDDVDNKAITRERRSGAAGLVHDNMHEPRMNVYNWLNQSNLNLLTHSRDISFT